MCRLFSQRSGHEAVMLASLWFAAGTANNLCIGRLEPPCPFDDHGSMPADHLVQCFVKSDVMLQAINTSQHETGAIGKNRQEEKEDEDGNPMRKTFCRTRSSPAENMAAAVGRRAAGALASTLSHRQTCYFHQSPCAASELLSRY